MCGRISRQRGFGGAGRFVAGCLALQALACGAGEWREPAWTASVEGGYIGYPSDGLLKSGPAVSVKLARNISRWWTTELSYFIAPVLDGNKKGEAPNIDRSWSQGGALDLALHLLRDRTTDPYLIVGGGVGLYDKAVLDDQYDFAFRAGLGFARRLSDRWILRLDGVAMLPGNAAEADFAVDAGLGLDLGFAPMPPPRRIGGADRFTAPPPAARRPPAAPPAPERAPTPYRPQPSPAAVVPVRPPPGLGSAAAGSPPPRPMVELDIQFAFNSATLDPAHFPALDRVGRMLAANPGLNVRIEGHTDWTPGANRDRNLQLSRQRAQAVLEYLADVHDIRRNRLTAVGYGFDRPKEPNDLKAGNPANRRVEVHFLSPVQP